MAKNGKDYDPETPMYLESPMGKWRALSKDEKVECLKKKEPLTLSLFQNGEAIFQLKVGDGIAGFMEIVAEAMADEPEGRE